MTRLTSGARSPRVAAPQSAGETFERWDEDVAREVSFERGAMPLLDQLYAAALRFTRNRAEAGELIVETYVKAYVSFGSFGPGGNLRVWLYRNLVTNYLEGCRQRQRRPGSHRSEVITDWQLVRIADGYTSTGLHSAELEGLDGLADGVVNAALDELPDGLRMAVYLADVEDFTYQEIAEILGVPLRTVIDDLQCGRRRLRELLRYQ